MDQQIEINERTEKEKLFDTLGENSKTTFIPNIIIILKQRSSDYVKDKITLFKRTKPLFLSSLPTTNNKITAGQSILAQNEEEGLTIKDNKNFSLEDGKSEDNCVRAKGSYSYSYCMHEFISIYFFMLEINYICCY
jgi:hypothetical protein